MNELKDRIAAVFREIRTQRHLADHFGGESLSFDDWMEQIREFIEEAGEFSLAYESIVSTLEAVPFQVSGPAAIRLLEAGLLLGYKTDMEEGVAFDWRGGKSI